MEYAVSHAHVEVIVPLGPEATTEQVLAEAEAMLAPYNQSHLDHADDWPDFTWDWFQVGGRWRGVHIANETVTDDIPDVTCAMCNGTGTRPDGLERFGAEWVEAVNGCNGCRGKGRHQPLSTRWEPHPVDVVKAVDVAADLTALFIVSPDGVLGTWGHGDGGGIPVPRLPGTWLVTLDCHS